MPLEKCPDCGKQISTAAPSCPQCGRPAQARQRLSPPPPPASTPVIVHSTAHLPKVHSQRHTRTAKPIVAILCAIIFVIGLATVWLYIAHSGANWPKFVSPDGDFEVSAPGELVRGKPAVDVVPNTVFQLMPSNNNHGIYFHVKRLDFPQEIFADLPSHMLDSALDAVRDQDVSAIHGQLVSDSPITIASHRGREIRISADGGNMLATERMCIVGNRVYIIVAVRKPSEEADAAAARFFDSFHLLRQ